MRSSHPAGQRRHWRDAGLTQQGRRQGRRVAIISLVVGMLLGLWIWLDQSRWLPDAERPEPMQVTRVDAAPVAAPPASPAPERAKAPQLPKAEPQLSHAVSRRPAQTDEAPVSDRAADAGPSQGGFEAPPAPAAFAAPPTPPAAPTPAVSRPAAPPARNSHPTPVAKPVAVPVIKPAPPPAQPNTLVGRGPKTFRELSATPVQ